MNNCVVSIVIPVYNCEEFLQKCVDSLLAQTYKQLEIILVDDGSTDASPEICDAYATKVPEIRVIHQKNRGAASARKAGLQQANGHFVLFVDSDDWVEPGYVENLVKRTGTPQIGAVVGTFQCYRNAERNIYAHYCPAGIYDKQRCETELFPIMLSASPFYSFGISPSMWGKLFRTELAKKNMDALDGGIIFGEDGCFTYSVLLDCESIYITEECGYIYRQNPASATHRFNEKLLQDGVKLKAFLERLAAEKKWDAGSQIDEYMAYVCNYTVSMALKAGYAATKEGKKRLKTYVAAVFPADFFRNKQYRECTVRTKVKYLLIKCGAFSVLSKLAS